MTTEEINEHIDFAKEQMEHAIEHLQKELHKIRTGKASGSLLEGILVEYYGSPTPMSQVANISVADSRTMVIQPWEKSMLAPIERAIFEANLGMTPQNDGTMVRLMIPPLTEERRKELVKKAKHLGEEAKVSVRNARRDTNEFIKKAVKNGYPEDGGKEKESVVQHLTDKYSEKIDHYLELKEKDILTV